LAADDPNANTDSNTDSNTDPYTDPYTDADSHADSHADSYSDTNPHADSDADPHTDAYNTFWGYNGGSGGTIDGSGKNCFDGRVLAWWEIQKRTQSLERFRIPSCSGVSVCRPAAIIDRSCQGFRSYANC
jgi:hypothetical protein